MTKLNIDNPSPIAIFGNVHTGKTNLMFYLAEQTERKKRYLLGYPKEIEGYRLLNSIDDMSKLHDCVLLIDELSKYFPLWEKKSNNKLIETFQFAAHNNIKIIFNTQITQAITKQIEAFIGQYAIKQIRMFSLKNGSMAKNILKHIIKHPNITSDMVKIENNEFVWFNELAEIGENGIHEFPDMNIGKDWNSKK